MMRYTSCARHGAAAPRARPCAAAVLAAALACACGSADRPAGAREASLAERPAAGPSSQHDARGAAPALVEPASYRGEIEGQDVELVLISAGEPFLTGALTGLGAPLIFTGERRGDLLSGRLTSGEGVAELSGEFLGGQLALRIGDGGAQGEDLEDAVFSATLVRADFEEASGARDTITAAAIDDGERTIPPMPAAQATGIFVNGAAVTEAARRSLEINYGLRIAAGRYWYDATSGAWGFDGGPTVGYLQPGMPVAAPLRADASGGQTPVLVNGRALHPYDLMSLQALLGPINPGRYSLDAYGNLGIENGPALVNLPALMQTLIQRQQQAQVPGPGWESGGAGGDGGWRSNITGAGGNESGGSGYVMGDGWSVSY